MNIDLNDECNSEFSLNDESNSDKSLNSSDDSVKNSKYHSSYDSDNTHISINTSQTEYIYEASCSTPKKVSNSTGNEYVDPDFVEKLFKEETEVKESDIMTFLSNIQRENKQTLKVLDDTTSSLNDEYPTKTSGLEDTESVEFVQISPLKEVTSFKKAEKIQECSQNVSKILKLPEVTEHKKMEENEVQSVNVTNSKRTLENEDTTFGGTVLKKAKYFDGSPQVTNTSTITQNVTQEHVTKNTETSLLPNLIFKPVHLKGIKVLQAPNFPKVDICSQSSIQKKLREINDTSKHLENRAMNTLVKTEVVNTSVQSSNNVKVIPQTLLPENNMQYTEQLKIQAASPICAMNTLVKTELVNTSVQSSNLKKFKVIPQTLLPENNMQHTEKLKIQAASPICAILQKNSLKPMFSMQSQNNVNKIKIDPELIKSIKIKMKKKIQKKLKKEVMQIAKVDSLKIKLSTIRKLKEMARKDVIQWLMDLGTITSRYICPNCSKDLKLAKSKSITDKYVWRCRNPKSRNKHVISRSIRTGSIFQNSRLKIEDILMIIHCWVYKVPYEWILLELQNCTSTVTVWMKICRELCTEICAKDGIQIGGKDKVVQIQGRAFEKHVFEKVEFQWIFYGLEDAYTEKYFFKIVNKCDKESFLRTVKSAVLPGTTVVSEFCSKFCLDEGSFNTPGYTSYNFVSFENFKSKIKSWDYILRQLPFKHKKNDSFDSYICEYIWRKRSTHALDKMKKFLSDVKQIYPLPIKDT